MTALLLLTLGAAPALPPAAMTPPAAALNRPAATWNPPAAAELRAQLQAWLPQATADAALRERITALWPADSPAPADPLGRLAESFALADPRAAAIVERCGKPHAPGQMPAEEWLRNAATPPLVGHNLRLYYARWLCEEMLYDEAQEQLAGLTPAEVADPAALLFYQAVTAHRLLDREHAQQAVRTLLRNEEHAPRRYVAVARLLADDLKDLKPDSLDHIARRMDDVRRRLELGRAGPKVRKVEDGVIESLDKLIKQMEDQQQQQSGGAQAAQPAAPAQDSTPAGGKGPGDVTRKNIGHQSGWGNISPKQREEALQQIGRDFPPQYRELIEQYFRQLANEGSP